MQKMTGFHSPKVGAYRERVGHDSHLRVCFSGVSLSPRPWLDAPSPAWRTTRAGLAAESRRHPTHPCKKPPDHSITTRLLTTMSRSSSRCQPWLSSPLARRRPPHGDGRSVRRNSRHGSRLLRPQPHPSPVCIRSLYETPRALRTPTIHTHHSTIRLCMPAVQLPGRALRMACTASSRRLRADARWLRCLPRRTAAESTHAVRTSNSRRPCSSCRRDQRWRQDGRMLISPGGHFWRLVCLGNPRWESSGPGRGVIRREG